MTARSRCEIRLHMQEHLQVCTDGCTASVRNSRTYVRRLWFEQHGVVSTRIRSIFHMFFILSRSGNGFLAILPLCPSSPLHLFRLLMVSCSNGYMTEFMTYFGVRRCGNCEQGYYVKSHPTAIPIFLPAYNRFSHSSTTNRHATSVVYSMG